MNQQDTELLNIANRLLDEQFALKFAEPGALQAALVSMKQQCLLLRKRNSSLLSKPQRKLRRLLRRADEALK